MSGEDVPVKLLVLQRFEGNLIGQSRVLGSFSEFFDRASEILSFIILANKCPWTRRSLANDCRAPSWTRIYFVFSQTDCAEGFGDTPNIFEDWGEEELPILMSLR